MSSFLSAMFAEMGARRRRLREALGDRGQGLVEFLVLGGLALGSLGLLAQPWMASAAPWGFSLPIVFIAGHLLIESRRQAARGGEAGAGYDWVVLGWSFACALLGAAAFVIALNAAPWTPPEDAVLVDILP